MVLVGPFISSIDPCQRNNSIFASIFLLPPSSFQLYPYLCGMKSITKQVIHSLILAGVLVGLTVLLQSIESTAKLIHPQVWGILIFSFLLGLLVVFVGDWGMRNMDDQSRPNLFLGLTVLRMILSMIFIGIIVFTGLEQKVLWVGNFFMIYLFYLVFEIVTILSNLRAISAQGEKP